MNTELHIIMDPQGNVSVTGPLDNRGVCYMMLGLAWDVVHDRQPQPVTEEPGQQRPRLVVPGNGLAVPFRP